MNGPTRPALELAGVELRFGDRRALHDVSVQVRPGEFVGLAGPNGSGKTSLLRAALGLAVPAAGTVRLFGDEVGRLSVRERARRAAWVPQEEPLRDNVPIATYVLYGRFAHLGPFDAESPVDRARARAALAEVGLADRAADGVLEVSGGERQRLVLARALCQDAPLLLLDEPTAHLDIGHQIDLLARVRALVRDRGVAAVAAIHDLNLAARYADRIVVLSRGRVVADGAPASVLSPALLRSVWGVDADLRTDPRSGLPYLLPRGVGSAAPGAGDRKPRGTVHVVGGGGSGAEWMRELVEAGFGVSAGALHLLDSDAELAESLGIPTALEAPFAPLSEAVRSRNRALMAAARAVVVAEFATGPSNLGNLEDVVALPPAVRRILVARRPPASLDFAGGEATRLRAELRATGAIVVTTVAELLRALEAPGGGGAEPPRAG